MTRRRRDVFVAAYNYLAAFDDREQDEAYWMEAAERMGALMREHDGDGLLMGLLMACYEEMEREGLEGARAGQSSA